MNEFTRPREERRDLVGGGCQIETNKKTIHRNV